MRRPILIAALAVSLIALAVGSYFRHKGCRAFDEPEQNAFSILKKGRKITFIGWYHGREEREQAKAAFFSIMDDAKNGRCQDATMKVDAYFKKYFAQEKESRRILLKLQRLDSQKPLSAVALEYGPSQYRKEFVDPATGADVTSDYADLLRKRCPGEERELRRLTAVFPGPEFDFALRTEESPSPARKIRLIPMGSDELVDETFKGLSQETLTFVEQLETLSDEGRTAYEKFSEMLNAGEPIARGNVAGLLQTVSDPERKKLETYFREINQMMSLLEKRNEDLMSKILITRGNIAVVIGNYHIPGLRKLADSICD